MNRPPGPMCDQRARGRDPPPATWPPSPPAASEGAHVGAYSSMRPPHPWGGSRPPSPTSVERPLVAMPCFAGPAHHVDVPRVRRVLDGRHVGRADHISRTLPVEAPEERVPLDTVEPSRPHPPIGRGIIQGDLTRALPSEGNHEARSCSPTPSWSAIVLNCRLESSAKECDRRVTQDQTPKSPRLLLWHGPHSSLFQEPSTRRTTW